MKLIASPIVVMLDIFMLLILAMIMEKSPDIKIVPDSALLDMVVVTSKDGTISSYYDQSEQKWKTIKGYTDDNKYIIGGIPCSTEVCKDIPDPLKGQKLVYFTGELERELSSLITDSCLAFPQECTQVTYHITKNGQVDKARLCKEFPVFKKILKKESCQDYPVYSKI